MKMLVRIIKINFLRNLEINQNYTKISGVFIQEKQLNLGKNSEFWFFSLPFSHSPSSTAALKMSSLNNHHSCEKLAA